MSNDIAEIGKGTRFGEGQDPNKYAQAGGKKAWSVRNKMRYLAAQEVDADNPEAFKIRGKTTRADLIAMKTLQRANDGDIGAVNTVIDNLDGKVAQPFANDPENPLINSGPVTDNERLALLAGFVESVRARIASESAQPVEEVAALPGPTDASPGV